MDLAIPLVALLIVRAVALPEGPEGGPALSAGPPLADMRRSIEPL